VHAKIDLLLHRIEKLQNHIYQIEIFIGKLHMQNAELYTALTALQPTLSAAAERINVKLAEVTAALNTCTNGEVPQTVADAVAAVQVAVNALDALVPAA
jgi:hypothetical protein